MGLGSRVGINILGFAHEVGSLTLLGEVMQFDRKTKPKGSGGNKALNIIGSLHQFNFKIHQGSGVSPLMCVVRRVNMLN